MTINLLISLPKAPYMHRLHMVLASPVYIPPVIIFFPASSSYIIARIHFRVYVYVSMYVCVCEHSCVYSSYILYCEGLTDKQILCVGLLVVTYLHVLSDKAHPLCYEWLQLSISLLTCLLPLVRCPMLASS